MAIALAVVLIAGALAIGIASCRSKPPEVVRSPALPPGFLDARLPDVPLNGYLYVAQTQPTAFDLSTLIDGAGLPAFRGRSLAAWVGPDPRACGLDFAQTADSGLMMATGQGSEYEGFGIGADYYVLKGHTDWTGGLKAAVTGGRFVDVRRAYPDAWRLLQELPASPRDMPIAAGFGRLDREFVDGLQGVLPGLGRDIANYVSALRARDIAFAAYAAAPVEQVAFSSDSLERDGLGAVLAVRSRYPGFLVSLAFGRAAGSAGMDKRTVGGIEVRHATVQGAHVLVKDSGSLFLVAVSADETMAERLIVSAATPSQTGQ